MHLHIVKLNEISNEIEQYSKELVNNIKDIVSHVAEKIIQTDKRNYSSHEIFIVGKEFAFGYRDESGEAYNKDDFTYLTNEQLNTLKITLQDLVNELTDQYCLNILINPGTWIYESGSTLENEAFFFSKEEGIQSVNKDQIEYLKWGTKVIGSAICATAVFSYISENCDIVYIPSSGLAFSDRLLPPKPGALFINADYFLKSCQTPFYSQGLSLEDKDKWSYHTTADKTNSSNGFEVHSYSYSDYYLSLIAAQTKWKELVKLISFNELIQSLEKLQKSDPCIRFIKFYFCKTQLKNITELCKLLSYNFIDENCFYKPFNQYLIETCHYLFEPPNVCTLDDFQLILSFLKDELSKKAINTLHIQYINTLTTSPLVIDGKLAEKETSFPQDEDKVFSRSATKNCVQSNGLIEGKLNNDVTEELSALSDKSLPPDQKSNSKQMPEKLSNIGFYTNKNQKDALFLEGKKEARNCVCNLM